jgi:hypothetical protein
MVKHRDDKIQGFLFSAISLETDFSTLGDLVLHQICECGI